jgi:hypothetical protein
MPLLANLRNFLTPRLRSGSVRIRIVWVCIAFVILTIAVFPAIGFEIVQRLDRTSRLSTPVTWIAGALVGIVLMAAVSAIPIGDPLTPETAAAHPRAQPTAAFEPSSAPSLPTPEPTPESTVLSTPAPTAEPTISTAPRTAAPSQNVAFSILFPTSGATVLDADVVVEGFAAPGARIVRDISFQPDQSTVAGADGAWSISVSLSTGANALVFRVGDDRASAIKLTVYRAAPVATPAPPTATASTVAWPAEYDLLVCGAVREIDDAGEHLAQAGTAGEDLDLDAVIEHSEKAAQDGAEARDMLSHVPNWKPGAAVIEALNLAADTTIKSANLMELGAETLDAAVVDEAAAAMADAFDAKTEAAVAQFVLQNETGFSCFG